MTALGKRQIEASIADRFGHVFERHEKLPAQILPTGIADIDKLWRGFPRGAITEIHGAPSSGRTSILLSALASATLDDETCALVDCADTFDLLSAAKAGVIFNQLLWVRCAGTLEHAFKSVDLLLHGGGFGVIVLDLGDIPEKTLRRIISTWWFRFRRAIENTPTALIVITPVACVRSCAAMAWELKSERAVWPSTVSVVSEKYNGPRKAKTDRQLPNLSLVADPNSRPSIHPAVNHSHLLQQQTIGIHRVRPLGWSDADFRFRTHRLP